MKERGENVLDVAGSWKPDPEKVLTIAIKVAKTWRSGEALERRTGSTKGTARGNDSLATGKAKERSEKEDGKDSKEVSCWTCWEVAHRRKWCPHWKSKDEDQVDSSQQSSQRS